MAATARNWHPGQWYGHHVMFHVPPSSFLYTGKDVTQWWVGDAEAVVGVRGKGSQQVCGGLRAGWWQVEVEWPCLSHACTGMASEGYGYV